MVENDKVGKRIDSMYTRFQELMGKSDEQLRIDNSNERLFQHGEYRGLIIKSHFDKAIEIKRCLTERKLNGFTPEEIEYHVLYNTSDDQDAINESRKRFADRDPSKAYYAAIGNEGNADFELAKIAGRVALERVKESPRKTPLNEYEVIALNTGRRFNDVELLVGLSSELLAKDEKDDNYISALETAYKIGKECGREDIVKAASRKMLAVMPAAAIGTGKEHEDRFLVLDGGREAFKRGDYRSAVDAVRYCSKFRHDSRISGPLENLAEKVTRYALRRSPESAYLASLHSGSERLKRRARKRFVKKCPESVAIMGLNTGFKTGDWDFDRIAYNLFCRMEPMRAIEKGRFDKDKEMVRRAGRELYRRDRRWYRNEILSAASFSGDEKLEKRGRRIRASH